MRARALLPVFICLTFVASACGSSKEDVSAPPIVDTPVREPINWDDCPDEMDSSLDCATIDVPLDYADRSGEQITLQLVRSAGLKPRKRVGAILFNPGGPGESGVDFVADGLVFSAGTLSDDMNDTFDYIGFDPRGVGKSSELRCVTDEWRDDHAYPDDTPDTEEEETIYDESRNGLQSACREKYGDKLGFYSTENIARDMDEIRSALGDETISYYGASWGTYLGAVYASIFPNRVRAMVLDSAYDPSETDSGEQLRLQLEGFEKAFTEWAQNCQDTPTCAFNSPDVIDRWTKLRAKLDENPAPSKDGGAANQSVLDTATAAALYSRSAWPILSAALAQAEGGDGATLLTLADSYSGRSEDGEWSNVEEMNGIITCASGNAPEVPDDIDATIDEYKELAPHLVGNLTPEDFGEPCEGLIENEAFGAFSYSGSGPIMVVGGKNDPATPFVWAERMSGELGPNAFLVTFTGEGHTSFLSNTCVTELVDSLIVKAAKPDGALTCDVDKALEIPSWFNEVALPENFVQIDIGEALALFGVDPAVSYLATYTSTSSPAAVSRDLVKPLSTQQWSIDTQQSGSFEPGTSNALFTQDDERILSFVAISKAELLKEPTVAGVADLIPDGGSIVLKISGPQP